MEFGLYLTFYYGFAPGHLEVLSKLSDAEWHTRHEDVVTALEELGDKRAAEVLYRAAIALHPYRRYDKARSLAVKAIWALGKLSDPGADEKLRLLAQSGPQIVRDEALHQLERRQRT